MGEAKKREEFSGTGGAPRNKYSALIAGVKLRPPAPPQAPAELPGNTARRYPVLQELAAGRQEIHDEFTKRRLELGEIRSRIEEDLAAVTGSAPAKPPEKAAAEAVKLKAAAAPAAMPPAERRGEPGPARKPSAGPRLPASRIFIAAAVCAAAFGLFRSYGGTPVTRFALPPTRAAGLCLDPAGSHAYFADPQRQLLFTVSVAEKRVRAMQSFPAQGLKGLAFDGTSFWSTDGNSVYRHGGAAGNYAVLGVYKPGAGLSSISWDGGSLWAASEGGKLIRYSPGGTLAREGEYQLPEGRSAGISVSGGKLWLLDPGSGKLSAYKPGAEPELLFSADLKPLLSGGEISGFSVSGDHLWIISGSPSGLVRIALKDLKFS